MDKRDGSLMSRRTILQTVSIYLVMVTEQHTGQRPFRMERMPVNEWPGCSGAGWNDGVCTLISLVTVTADNR